MLCDNNFENNLDASIVNNKIEADQLYSGYVYGDIDDRRQNSILKLLSVIENIKLKTIVITDTSVPTITYHSKGRLIPLNK